MTHAPGTGTPDPDTSGTARFLVLHDYGMGGAWWWVRARSAQEIVLACAEVEVVTDPESIARARARDDVGEVRLDDPGPNPLSDLRARRAEQRGLPGFGALAGRERVYLCEQEDCEARYCVLELGPDGRMVRQVVVAEDGGAQRGSADDVPFNPPYDLYDPAYAAMEITREAFERAWGGARPAPDA